MGKGCVMLIYACNPPGLYRDEASKDSGGFLRGKSMKSIVLYVGTHVWSRSLASEPLTQGFLSGRQSQPSGSATPEQQYLPLHIMRAPD